MNFSNLVNGCCVFALLLLGQSENNSVPSITVTVVPQKKVFKLHEELEFEIRLENHSEDTCRIIKKINGHFLVHMIGPGGRKIECECAVVSGGHINIDDTFELSPGCFYGEKCKWLRLEYLGTKLTCHTFYSFTP